MSSRRNADGRAGLVADVVFVGITRPAMALGVPYVAVLGNAFITLELFLVTRNLLWLLAALPIHGLTFLVCVAEPRFFDLLHVWALARRRAGFVRSRRWGAVSYAPLSAPARRAFRFAPTVTSMEEPC